MIKIRSHETVPPADISLHTCAAKFGKRSAFIAIKRCRHKLSYDHEVHLAVVIEICKQCIGNHSDGAQTRANLFCSHHELSSVIPQQITFGSIGPGRRHHPSSNKQVEIAITTPISGTDA